MSCIGHDITLVSQPGQIVLTDHPELYMNLKNDFLWQMPWWHVLFFMPETGAGTLPDTGSGTLPEVGSDPFARDGVRHFVRDGVRHFVRDGVRHFVRGGGRHFARDEGRPLCPSWGQAPLPAVGSDPIGDCDISALALYSALFYNSWCW